MDRFAFFYTITTSCASIVTIKGKVKGNIKADALTTIDAGTTGGYHVEECELIHSYLLVKS